MLKLYCDLGMDFAVFSDKLSGMEVKGRVVFKEQADVETVVENMHAW